MTGEEAISYIHSMVWNRKATGYEHAKALLAKMGNPQKQLKYVHIGGTNGKGSTAAMMAAVLQAAGYKVGLYTSPYIYRFHERMQINGVCISDEELAETTEEVKKIADEMPDCPSEFALVSCIAFSYFAKQECDIVVLEVGMGGANDSTNVIDCPEVAMITNIGLDHTEYLGSTLEEIAKTKAGILKANGTAVFYPNEPSVEAVFRKVCEEKHIGFAFADFQDLRLRKYSLEGQIFDYKGWKGIQIPLLGEHQLRNAAMVLSAVEQLQKKGWDIHEDQVRQGLMQVRWPGRFEVIRKAPLFIIDGGHNTQCIEALAQNVRDYLKGKRVVAITGVVSDKDYGAMYQPILPLISEFICITPPTPRKLSGETLAAVLRNAGAKAEFYEDIKEAILAAKEKAGEDGAVLCFGSFYSLEEVRKNFS